MEIKNEVQTKILERVRWLPFRTILTELLIKKKTVIKIGISHNNFGSASLSRPQGFENHIGTSGGNFE